MELRGRPALVTGAARRVGRAIALALADEGMSLALHWHTSESEARQLAEEISAKGVKASLHQGDLSDRDFPTRLIEEVKSEHGDLGLLVNSASIFEAEPHPVTDDRWDRHLEVNLTAPMRLIRDATPLLESQGGGAVVNLIDACWDRPTWTQHTAYCVSKAGLAALTMNFARVLAPSIRVNAVAPGATIPPESATEAENDKAIAKVPLKRWGDPQEIARAVIMMARNDFMTGQILPIDGGRSVV